METIALILMVISLMTIFTVDTTNKRRAFIAKNRNDY